MKKRIMGVIILIGVILMAGGAGSLYYIAFKENIKRSDQRTYINIPGGSDYQDVYEILKKEKILINPKTFDWLAHKKNYHHLVNPGHYEIRPDMNNNQLINMLRAGEQEPVHVVFHNIRTKGELAQVVSRQIEMDSASLVALLNDKPYLSQLGFNENTILAMFIPNTYEFFWNTDAKGFMERMHREYNHFWNQGRQAKLENLSLNKKEVSTLASIVDEETRIKDEMPTIAGVYINRLNRGIPLQADPTIKYALEDFTIRRVLKKHLEIESPYNTYKNRGLPPGPIVVPSIAAIDAVLNHEEHKYLYFCAKDDFSGSHVFAKTLRQHLQNARKYQRALSENNIYK